MAARRKKRGPTVKEILKNDYLSEIFTDFLEASLCQENLLFFRAVEEYNQRVTDEGRKEKYDEIVNMFLSSESEFEMDFPEELITMVLDTPDPEPDIFLELQAEAYAVMSRDALPRFLASPIYKDFLENPPDTPEVAKSRRKLEEFFGEELVGPLTRSELVKFRSTGMSRSRRSRRGLWNTNKKTLIHFGWASSSSKRELRIREIQEASSSNARGASSSSSSSRSASRNGSRSTSAANSRENSTKSVKFVP